MPSSADLSQTVHALAGTPYRLVRPHGANGSQRPVHHASARLRFQVTSVLTSLSCARLTNLASAAGGRLTHTNLMVHRGPALRSVSCMRWLATVLVQSKY